MVKPGHPDPAALVFYRGALGGVMENEDSGYSGSGNSNSAIPDAGKVVGRLSEFWDEVAEKTGQGKGMFFDAVFGVMWRDNGTGFEQEKMLDSWFEDQTEDMKPLALLQAAFTSCAYAVDAIKAEKGGDLLEAWRCTSKANYWLGITIGSWSIRNEQPRLMKEFARRGADARHVENRAMKQDVFKWLDANMDHFSSMDSAAEAIAKGVVPAKFRTARDWVGEWKKIRAAGKP